MQLTIMSDHTGSVAQTIDNDRLPEPYRSAVELREALAAILDSPLAHGKALKTARLRERLYALLARTKGEKT